MTDFDYGLAGRRTAWPVASPAEMFWPDILSPVSHLEGDREFADSPLEGSGFELPVRGAVNLCFSTEAGPHPQTASKY
jgi:hypothetical protein